MLIMLQSLVNLINYVISAQGNVNPFIVSRAFLGRGLPVSKFYSCAGMHSRRVGILILLLFDLNLFYRYALTLIYLFYTVTE